MPTIDKRNTSENLHYGGSDVGLAVFLTAAEAQQIYGDAAVEGWYIFGTFDGGSLSREVESEQDRDEAGQLTGKNIVTTDDWVIENTVKESDDATLKLLIYVLSKSPHKYRYALPAGEKEFDVDGMGTMETHPAHQVWGLYNGTVEPGFLMPTASGEKRMIDVTIRGSKTSSTPAFVFKTVYLGDQTTWQYVDGDDLSDFMDA